MACLLGLACAFLCAPARAFDYVEGADLSSDAAAPTPLELELGVNGLAGTVTTSGNPADTRDYITFTIPAAMQLTALRLANYTQPGGTPGNRGFHSINAGSASFVPSAANEGSFLGGAHLDPAPAGTDLLPNLASGATAGTGFAVPLGPGTYSYLVQQTGPQISEYSLEFVVESAAPAVPATHPLGLLAGAAGLLGAGALMRGRAGARQRAGAVGLSRPGERELHDA